MTIVKHKLYDIDVVIDKTLVVGAMAAIVTAGYLLVVVGVGSLVGLGTRDPILPLLSTALVAIAFEPVRRRVQHSEATVVSVTGGVCEGRMWVEVTDDGRGGADGRRGSGLHGLADRLATRDGVLTVDSPIGRGTRLRAVIPCA